MRSAALLVIVLALLAAPLASAGADLDDKLIKAAKKGDVEKIEALLAQGADPRAANRKGETALMLAQREHHTAAADALSRAIVVRDFEDAKSSDTLDAFRAFVRAHPGAKEAAAAKEKIDDLMFRHAAEVDTVAAYREYLAAEGATRHTGEAMQKIDALDFAAAESAGTVAAYRAYLDAHAGGARAADAKAGVLKLESDAAKRQAEAVCRKADTENSPEAISACLEQLYLRPRAPGEKLDPARIRELFSRLRRLGAPAVASVDLASKGKWGETPLHVAAKEGNLLQAAGLVERGADLEAKIPVLLHTPLHVAALSGKPLVAALLLTAGADASVECAAHRTAVHMAAMKGKVDVLRVLAVHGADLKALSETYSALDLTHDEATATFLKSRGVKSADAAASAIPSPPTSVVSRCGAVTYENHTATWICADEANPYGP